MRFDRTGHYAFRDTERKRQAFERKKKKEQERYPLFAEQIAAEQRDVDTEMSLRRASWDRHEVSGRAQRARDWIRARAKLATYPSEVRKELQAYWSRCGWPATPTYLLSMMHMHDTGRLDLYPAPVHLTEERRKACAATIERLRARAAARCH
jgi:phytoene dehydrogenase-like protein